MEFWLLLVLFGFGLVGYRKSKGHLHTNVSQTIFGDIALCCCFALILSITRVPALDFKSGDYADGEAYARMIFGFSVLSIVFGIAYCVVRFKPRK
jgi:hypothetical protein